MTFVPIDQETWSDKYACLYGYQNRAPENPPDAMIVREDGKYSCAVGPDWSQDYFGVFDDAETAKYECEREFTKRVIEARKHK